MIQSDCSVIGGPCSKGECSWWSVARQQCMHPEIQAQELAGKSPKARNEPAQPIITLRIDKSKIDYVALIFGVIMAFSVFLPWLSAEFFVKIQVSASDIGGWGWIFVLIAGIVSAVLPFVSSATKSKGVFHIVAGFCGLGLAGYDWWDIKREGHGIVSSEYGLFLCGIAAIALVIIGIIEFQRTSIRLPVEIGTAESTLPQLLKGKHVTEKPSPFEPATVSTTMELPKEPADALPLAEEPHQSRFSSTETDEISDRVKEALGKVREIQKYLSGLEELRKDKSIAEETYRTMESEYKKRMTDVQTQIAEMKLQLTEQFELLNNDVRSYSQELEKLTVRNKLGELPQSEFLEKYNDLNDRLLMAKREVDKILALWIGIARVS